VLKLESLSNTSDPASGKALAEPVAPGGEADI
jgi:hypothetical protein